MDGNGNKVKALRDQFEVLSNISNNEKRLPKSKSASNFAEIMGIHNDAGSDTIRNMMITGSRSGLIDTPLMVPPKYPSNNNNMVSDALIMSSLEGNNRRNGIYVSQSITLHSDPGDEEEEIGGETIYPKHDDDGGGAEDGDVVSENSEKTGNFNDTNSQGSASAYGKVKRSNAFRKKDVVDSVDSRFVKTKSKLSLERVKSLDTSGMSGSGLGDGQREKNAKAEVSRVSSVYVRSATGNHTHHHHHHHHPHHQPPPPPPTQHLHNHHQQLQQQQQQKAINVVAPYHVSELYSPSRSFKQHPDFTVFPPQQQPPRAPQGQTYASEVEYAVPTSNLNNNNSDEYPSLEECPPPIPPPPVFLQLVPSAQTSTGRPLAIPRENESGSNTKFSSSDGGASNTRSSRQLVPPEKPPRTFLYDILSDHATTQYQHNQRPLLTPGNPVDNQQRSRTARHFPNPGIPPPQEAHNNGGRQTVPVDSTIKQAPLSVASKDSGKGPSPKSGNSAKTSSSNNTNNPVGHRHGSSSQHPPPPHHHHQTLIRSKTESQIVVKNRNRSWESAVGLDDAHHQYEKNVMKSNNGSSNSGFAMLYSSNYGDYNSCVHPAQQRNPNLRMNNSALNVGNTTVRPYAMGNSQYGMIMSENFGGSTTGIHHATNGIAVGRSPVSLYSSDGLSNVPSHGLMTNIVNNGGNNNKNNNNASSSNVKARQGVNSNVNRCRSDDRLCEKSKSEWALHQVLGSGNEEGMVGISASGRRNTVANNVGNNTSGSSHNIHQTGHSSLESNASSNSSSKPLRSSIQQSIHNLMHQLFSTNAAMSSGGKDATSSTDSGIQLGSESLSSCDTPVGDSTTDTGDSDIENEVETSSNARQVVEARKGYIRQVSSFRVKELGSSDARLILNSKKPQIGEPLFECLLVVGLNRDAYTGNYHPYIKEMFPPNAKLASGVEQFCFPDSLEWPSHEGVTAQTYTLAITDHRGGRKYGCCFRILPEGANMCIPITYCLISSQRAIGFYREVLREVTLRHGCSEYQKKYWMEQLYNKQFPPPDGDICIQDPISEDTYVLSAKNSMACYNSVNYSQPKLVSIRRRADHRLDDHDVVTLLTRIDVTTVLKIFGSMLHERKVVLISRALSTLSLCMEALESILHPFTWQHTFIPILPLNMLDFLDAPSPFLFGVLRSAQSSLDKNFDDGMVVDLDTNKILRCVGDEGSILPKRINRKMRESLQCVINLGDQGDAMKNVLFSECFIRMFVEIMGHFGNHITRQADGSKDFEREAFIKSADTKATQNFLDWFSETSMFQYFIESRLKNNFKPGLFEQRIMGDQANHSNYGGPLQFKNYSKLQKNNRTFGINWLKDAFVMKS